MLEGVLGAVVVRPGSCGGSPPRARMLPHAGLRVALQDAAISASLWQTQVRCGTGSRRGLLLDAHHQVVRQFARRAARAVGHADERRLAAPPVRGSSGTTPPRPPAVFGGKNSKENVGRLPGEDVADVHGVGKRNAEAAHAQQGLAGTGRKDTLPAWHRLRATPMSESFQLVSPYQPQGDGPGHRETGQVAAGRKPPPDPARGDRSGKTFTMANVVAALGPADAGDVAQQDPGRPAVFRVQGLLPEQRGRVFRLATSTTTSPRPTSREPTPTSKRTRPSTTRSSGCRLSHHGLAADARGTCSSWPSVSCIYGLGSPEDYQNMMVPVHRGMALDRDDFLARAGGHALRAQRHRLRARQVPRARRRGRGLPGLSREHGGAGRVFRRRGGPHFAISTP